MTMLQPRLKWMAECIASSFDMDENIGRIEVRILPFCPERDL